MASARSTLSADAKDALARDLPTTNHCRAALRAGLVAYGGARDGTFRTRRLAIARLFRSLAGEHKDGPIRKSQERRLARAPLYEIDLADEREFAASRAARRPTARCDRRMEIRAAFLVCGSLATPVHGYHVEFVPPDGVAAERLAAVLEAEGHRPRRGIRRSRPVIYFKDIDAIVHLLSAIGAFAAVLRLEDIRALKETKNRIRRLVNTEAANVDRAAGAAALQRDAIGFLADAYGLRKLSPPLREIAVLRLTHPTETLAELGRRCTPAVGKSTVNGRIAALMRLARRLRGASDPQAGAASADAQLG